jgi:hypothetical protein
MKELDRIEGESGASIRIFSCSVSGDVMAQDYKAVMDLPHQHYPAIGEFLFRFAQLEYQLHEIVWACLDLDFKQGRILTIGTDGKALRQMAKTITSTQRWVKTQFLRQEVAGVVNCLKEHVNNRNAIAHGVWGSLTGQSADATLHFMKAPEERMLPRHDPSIDNRKIQTWCGHLRSWNIRAKKLIEKLNDARPSSQNKSSPLASSHQTSPGHSPKVARHRPKSSRE